MAKSRRRYRPEVWDTYSVLVAAHERYPDKFAAPDQYDDIEISDDPFVTADGEELQVTVDVVDQYTNVRAEQLIAEESGLAGEDLRALINYLKLQEA